MLSTMPYQKRLKKTYGAIESQTQSESFNSTGGGVLGASTQYNQNNNNNVSNFMPLYFDIVFYIQSLVIIFQTNTAC